MASFTENKSISFRPKAVAHKVWPAGHIQLIPWQVVTWPMTYKRKTNDENLEGLLHLLTTDFHGANSRSLYNASINRLRDEILHGLWLAE